MFDITSPSNPIIKLAKGLSKKKDRWANQQYIVEGKKMVVEALNNNVEIKNIIISESFFLDNQDYYNNHLSKFKRLIKVPNNIYSLISTLENSEGILGIIHFDAFYNNQLSEDGVYIYLDGIQDPGNLGTIIRSCDAFSLSGIIISEGTTDPFSPKVTRSSMGSIFRVKLFFFNKEELLQLKEKKYRIVSTTIDGAISMEDFIFSSKDIIIIGNEANGICEEILNKSDVKITIPMRGKSESLNAGVAASIIMYKASNLGV